MAFLKETPRSLRAYFIVVGVIGTLTGIVALREARDSQSVSMLVTLAIWLPGLGRVILGPAFAVAGIKLNRALETGAAGTKQLVKIAAACVVAETVLFVLAVTSLGVDDSAQLAEGTLARTVVPLLILWYVHSSLERLALESQRHFVDTVANKFD